MYCSFRILHDYEAPPRPEVLKGALPSFATRVASSLPRLPAPRSEQPMTRKPSSPCARAEHTAPGGRRRKRSAELWMWIEQIWSRDGDWREGERRILRKRMHVCTVSTHRAGAKRCQNLQDVGGAAFTSSFEKVPLWAWWLHGGIRTPMNVECVQLVYYS